MTYLKIVDDIIVMGCASCKNGRGWFRLNNISEPTYLLKEYSGETMGQLGHSALLTIDAVGQLRLELSAVNLDRSELALKTVVMARDREIEGYTMTEDTVTIRRDLLSLITPDSSTKDARFLNLFRAGDVLFFMIGESGELNWVRACETNHVYRDDGKESYCERCHTQVPYSGGFQSTECRSCAWLWEFERAAFYLFPLTCRAEE